MNAEEIDSIISELYRWKNFNSASLFLIKRVCELNDWPYGELWLPDIKNELMIWSEFWCNDNEYFENFSKFSSLHKFAKGVGLIGTTWQNKNINFIEDVSKTTIFLRSSIASSNDLNSAICIPIFNNNIVICIHCFFLKKLSPVDIKNANLFFSFSDAIGKTLADI